MAEIIHKNEFLDKYCSEIMSRVVTESGIPSDKYHLGKIILQNLKDDPDFTMQIDGGTGESETNESVLRRSIQCATSFRNMGLKTGDVMILMAPNHLDLAIPFYAALYLGIAIAAIDRAFEVHDLRVTFDIDKPKIIICQSEKVQDIQKALELLKLDAKIISFDKSEHTLSFPEMLEKYGENIEVQDFKAAEFDPEETLSFLVSTSGTTGLPKAVALTHKSFLISGPHIYSFSTKFPEPFRSSLLVTPLQWLSGILNFVFSPLFKFTRIQSAKPLTTEHVFDVIEKYQPEFLVVSPTVMAIWLNAGDKVKCNLSNFKIILMGGSAVPKELIEKLKHLLPNTEVGNSYGISEAGGLIFHSIGAPPGSSGVRYSHIQCKLMNTETGDEIKEPYKCGELWIKGPGVFKGYYNNSDGIEEAFSKDGWFMSGDLMYRDENWNFYFVERIRLLLDYKGYQISPLELETVIRQHPGVSDVVVTGVPGPERGDLPVACIMPRLGAEISAQEIHDLVKEKLSDAKQLRGGVIFLKELPLTSTTKVHRRKIKEIALAHARGQSSSHHIITSTS